MSHRFSRFHLYTAAVAAVGLALLTWTLLHQTAAVVSGAPLLLFVLVVCVLAGELVPINVVLRGQEGELLTSTAFAFAVLIAFGPGAAIPALCFASLIGDLARGKAFRRALFNVGQYAIALFVAGRLLGAITDVPRAPLASFVATDLPLILLCGLVFFAVNVMLVATVIALSSGYPIWTYYFNSDFLVQSST